MPFAFEMGAKTWRDPVTHAKFVEEEKKRREKEKKKDEDVKFFKEVEAERSKLIREKVATTGRLVKEGKENDYLAKLKADVACLEGKKTGQTPEKLLAAHDAALVKNETKDRETFVGIETKLTAAEMVKLQEKELTELKKKAEREVEQLAERRRRELLEYKHTLGLSSPPGHSRPPRRPSRFPNRPLSLQDDPEFWRLSEQDRAALELMSPEERAEVGWGPYDEDEVEYDPELHARFEGLGIGSSKLRGQGAEAKKEEHLKERMKRFFCTEQPNIPGILRRFPPLALSLPLFIVHPSQYETQQEQQEAHQILQQEAQVLREDMIRMAIETTGANGMVGFKFEGPVELEDEAAKAEGYLSQLVAEGHPVRLDPRALPSALGAKGKNKHVRFGHPSQRQQRQQYQGAGGGGFDNPWATDAWAGVGGGGQGGWNNGGAGWTDPPAVGGGGDGGWGWGGGQQWGDADEPWAGGGGGAGGGGWNAGTGGGGTGWDGWNGGGGNGGWGQEGVPGGWGGGNEGGWVGGNEGGWAEQGGAGGTGWDAWGQQNAGWGGAKHPSGSQTRPNHLGAVWTGLPTGGGWGAKPTRPPGHGQPQPPAGLRNLPFGEQMYLKRVRAQQEREAREAAAALAAGVSLTRHPEAHSHPHPRTPFQPTAAAHPAGEEPLLFGNAFARDHFPFTPNPPSTLATPAAAAPLPLDPTAAAHFGAALAPQQAAQVPPEPAAAPPAAAGGGAGLFAWLRGQSAAPAPAPQPGQQQPTVDPDHGGVPAAGGWGAAPAVVPLAAAGGGGWGQPAAVAGGGAGAARVEPAAENGWKGAQAW